MAAFHVSPLGEFLNPWFNKPDTKFNANGLFHSDHDASGPEAEATAELIEAASKAHLQKYIQDQKMTPGEAKKWSVYLPFERLEDDDGNPTGVIRFTYKQNAKIKSSKEPSGYKAIKIELRDSHDNPMVENVWSGSEGRTMFSMRGIEMVSSKQVGVRLDLAKVQITKLQQGGASAGFGKVEGGFVASGPSPHDDNPEAPSEEEQGAY